MPGTIKNQLRAQLAKQLKEKTKGLGKTRSELEPLTSEVNTLQALIETFDTRFSANGTVDTKVRRKPGPKPRVPTETSETTTRRKPGPKPKAQASAKVKNNRATQGRRAVAQGLRPPIKKAMIEVIGKKTMNASEMYEALKAKEWLPDSSDPRAYISYLFSSLRDSFERVEGRGRGYYRARGVEDTKTKKPTTEATTPSSEDVDDVLKEAGVIPDAAPAN